MENKENNNSRKDREQSFPERPAGKRLEDKKQLRLVFIDMPTASKQHKTYVFKKNASKNRHQDETTLHPLQSRSSSVLELTGREREKNPGPNQSDFLPGQSLFPFLPETPILCRNVLNIFHMLIYDPTTRFLH